MELKKTREHKNKFKNLVYKNLVFLMIVFALLFTNNIYAQNFSTSFGFEFNLPDKWKKYPKEKIKFDKNKSLETKSEVYYLADNNIKNTFVDNIYISYFKASNSSGALASANEQKLESHCHKWLKDIKKNAADISASAKTQIKLYACKFIQLKEQKHKGLYISYQLTDKIGQMQYLLLLEQKNILITLSYSLEKKPKITQTFKNLIASIKLTNAKKSASTNTKVTKPSN